jgi:hypothetical protein
VKYFNTAGPCVAELHYIVPPEARLPQARGLVEEGHYFVLHAPRQTGKTTTLATLASRLTAEGTCAALLVSCERAEVAGDDYGAAELQVLTAISGQAHIEGLPPDLRPPDPWPDAPAGTRVFEGLRTWAERCPLPLVLFFDEIDALRGESLRSVLRQLRDGYRSRPHGFPASVVLCGLRDVRDYKAASGGDPDRLGTSSPFNISVESLRIGDFTMDDVAVLYGQHTAETGQEFTPAAIDRAFCYSQGQPWLTNALAREVTRVMRVAPPTPITAEHMDEAKERLIAARATHLDSLAARLREPRVKAVIEPLIAGTLPDDDPTYADDVAYVRDLGLITAAPPVAVANPIYREVIARVLGQRVREVITTDPARFLLPGGRLDFRGLLESFASFWRRNGEILAGGMDYREAAAQLVFMAYLDRIVNGGGFVDREYGIGRGRIDLLVRKPFIDPEGVPAVQREALELKAWHPRQGDPLESGLGQLDRYLDRLDLGTGTLAIFDCRPDAPPIAERTAFGTERTPGGRVITLLRA